MSDHPIEALLRPPVEITTGVAALASAFIAVSAPDVLMMTPSVAQGTGCLLGLYGIWCVKQGWYIVRYQRNLRRQKTFEIAASKIPISNKTLWLGRGFAWEERHTQRLADTRRTKFKQFVDHSRLYYFVRKHESKFENTFMGRCLASQSRLNPVRPLSEAGGLTTLHGVELDEVDIRMPLADRTGHTLVLGTTRVGKTRGLEVMVTQDIHRGEVVIVIDPKGDADLLARVYSEAKRAGREDVFYMFHLGFPEISARYNAIGSFNRMTEVATRLSGQLSGEGNSAVFREFAWRFVNIVSKALVALGRRPDYKSILQYVTSIDELFVKYVEHINKENEEFEAELIAKEATINDRNTPHHMRGRPNKIIAMEALILDGGLTDDVLHGLLSAMKYEKSYFDKIVASLLPLLEKLTTGKVAELLSPSYADLKDARPIFDWRKVINQKAVVYIGLDALTDTAVSAAVGNSMFADLISYLGERYKNGDHDVLGSGVSKGLSKINLHADEFNELMGDEFIPMVNKGGGSGLQVTGYSQVLADIEAGLGTRSKAQQTIGNFSNLMMYRVKDQETAELLTNQLPEVEVNSTTAVAGFNDTSDPDSGIDFTSRYEDRITTEKIKALQPHDIMKLPKGQAFVLLEGGRLSKLRLPLPKKIAEDEFESEFGDILSEMRRGYRSSAGWWADAAVEAVSVTDE